MNQRKHALFLRALVAAAILTMTAAYSATAQEADAQTTTRATQPVVPQMIRYTGMVANRTDEKVEIDFHIYASAQGGDPLWSETQAVNIGADGKYSVLLGAATDGGLPETVFQGGQARWLGVSVEREPESGRTVLASVAYAMKAADAESLAGRRASDFVTQDQLSAQLANTAQPQVLPGGLHPDVTPTGTGATNVVPLWTSSSTLGNSAITQLGTAAAPLVGVGTPTPATTLDVAGTSTLRNNVSLPPATAATATSGINSPQLSLGASSFQSGASAVSPTFAWQAVATGNNTATPSANLQLQFGATAAPAATGLSISSTGNISFASGQTFPGTGAGTITSVNSTSPITGGASNGPVTIGLNTAALETTLNGVYPQLATANSFTGNQGITGNLSVTGTETASSVTGATVNATALNIGASGALLTNNHSATTASGASSPNLAFSAAAYNSSSAQSVTQNFSLAAVPVGNNSATPSGQLALLYGAGGAVPAHTGLSFNSNGIINFVSGQSFPGTGKGTITGVTATSPITGGGTTGTVSVGLNTAALETTLDTVYPQLATANAFTGNQTITGNLTATGNGTVGGLATFNGGVTSTAEIALPAPAATAATGGTSPNLALTATGFNSTSTTSVPQTFAFSAVPVNNDTTSPTAKLELLFGAAGTAPAATGLAISKTGDITFAPGQTFPGVGTITGVTATSPITGGGSSGAITVGLNTSALETTLNGAYAQLDAPNEFTQSQTIDQNLTVNNTANAAIVNANVEFQLLGIPFDTGNYTAESSSLGYSLSPNETGYYDFGAGYGALAADTIGTQNTAVGDFALASAQDGSLNTAVGTNALYYTLGGCATNPPPPPSLRGNPIAGLGKQAHPLAGKITSNSGCANPQGMENTGVGNLAGEWNSTGIANTMLGYQAGPDPNSTGLIGSTAIGANSTVSQNYSLVLGQTTTTPGALFASVGIGTPTPMSALDISVLNSGARGPTITLTNPSGAGGASDSIDFNTTIPFNGEFDNYNPGARIAAEDTDYSDNISFYSNVEGAVNQGLRRNMTIYANGNVNVVGNLSKGGGSFKIDHPLDPADKYLYHSFVESPDMMNIYNGIVTLDAKGEATVQMPEWFQALNTDFRYQLTAIGAPGPNLYVAEEVNGNHFSVAGGKPGSKVSWQVTGIRQDAWANAHRIPVEEEKPAGERGKYLHPELFGATEDQRIGNLPNKK